MSRTDGLGALHNDPRATGRTASDAPACFRDFMGYHGISRAVKEMAGFLGVPGTWAQLPFSNG